MQQINEKLLSSKEKQHNWVFKAFVTQSLDSALYSRLEI